MYLILIVFIKRQWAKVGIFSSKMFFESFCEKSLRLLPAFVIHNIPKIYRHCVRPRLRSTDVRIRFGIIGIVQDATVANSSGKAVRRNFLCSHMAILRFSKLCLSTSNAVDASSRLPRCKSVNLLIAHGTPAKIVGGLPLIDAFWMSGARRHKNVLLSLRSAVVAAVQCAFLRNNCSSI